MFLGRTPGRAVHNVTAQLFGLILAQEGQSGSGAVALGHFEAQLSQFGEPGQQRLAEVYRLDPVNAGLPVLPEEDSGFDHHMLVGHLIAGEPPGEGEAHKDQHCKGQECAGTDQVGRGVGLKIVHQLPGAPGVPEIGPHLPVVPEEGHRDRHDGDPAAHQGAQRVDFGPRLVKPLLALTSGGRAVLLGHHRPARRA